MGDTRSEIAENEVRALHVLVAELLATHDERFVDAFLSEHWDVVRTVMNRYAVAASISSQDSA